MRAVLGAGLAATLPLLAQSGEPATPRPNRVAWFAVFPEPLPEGRSTLALEATSQFLRPDKRDSRDGRTTARLDGEEWQLTGDLAKELGPGRLNLRLRVVNRSGGFADQAFVTWHTAFGIPNGGRELAPKFDFLYHLERDGVVVADLRHAKTQLLDADLAYVVPFGDESFGGRAGVSVQLPTGRRSDFSGSGGTDGLVGAMGWKRWTALRAFVQLERVVLGVSAANPYRAVLAHRSFTRGWAGIAFQGDGPGFWGGLGAELSLGASESPYAVQIGRLDRAAWQQHITLTHRALPRWRFGISEEAGTYTAPDITAFVSYRFGS
ncbi:MAG: DUF3187 family protein [Holophagaceae bacterium]|nr:DUF3187 family protein [Holophagaceae bacterium]